MTFEEYCVKKKIDPETFRKHDFLKWQELEQVFLQVSEESFTQQKKFLINDLRRRFPYKEIISQPTKTSSAVKPKIKANPVIPKKS